MTIVVPTTRNREQKNLLERPGSCKIRGWSWAAEMPASVGPWVRFTLVVITTTLATLALHHFAILRIPPLRFAFNGKWR